MSNEQTKSILPEVKGWKVRLQKMLSSVESRKTFTRPFVSGDQASPNRTEDQEWADFWYRIAVGTVDQCWPWKAGVISKATPYGSVFMFGRNQRANRISATVRYGELSSDLFACHRCDNHSCCNPHHLFIGKHSDNNWDRAKKGRSNPRIGTEVNTAVLSEEQVLKVMEESKTRTVGWIPAKVRELGVSRCAIRKIVDGQSWKHLKI